MPGVEVPGAAAPDRVASLIVAVSSSNSDRSHQLHVDATQRRETIRAEKVFSLSGLVAADLTNPLCKKRLAEALGEKESCTLVSLFPF